MTRSPLWLTLLMSMLTLAMVITPASGSTLAQSTQPQLIRQITVPGLSEVKLPEVLGVGNRAYLAGVSGRNDTRDGAFVTIDQPFQTSAVSGVTTLGNGNGNAFFSTAVMAVGPDNAVYYAWIRSSNKDFKIRRKGPNDTEFGPERMIVSGGGFRVRPDLAVTSDGKIMAIWDENSRYRFKVSSDGGNTWSGTQVVAEDGSRSRPYLAADSVGGIWVTYGTNDGSVRAGYWRGGEFAMRNLTPDYSGSNYFNDPSITVTPNNVPYVSWRRVQGGIYYAVRDAATGNWNQSRLVTGKATSYGTVAIASDREGNIHIAWAGDTSGSFEVWYAYKQAGQDTWQGPFRGSNDGDLDTNFNISTTLNDFSYGHVIGERFSSEGLVTRYSVYQSTANSCAGTLALRDTSTNSTEVTDENPISGTITPTNCTPQKMQITLNTPPDANTAKLNYVAGFAKDVPLNVAGSQCVQTVYVHLYKDDSAAFSTGAIFSKSIILDPPGDVDAVVQTLNPNAGLSTVFTPFAGDAGTAAGASGGDPAWTRTPTYLMQIQNNGDCTGLKAFAVAGGAQTNFTSQFANVLPLPTTTLPAPGLKSFDVAVTDTIGNIKTFNKSITYDPLDDPNTSGVDDNGRPTVISGTLANDNSNAAARKSILRTLSFSGVNVTDTLYRLGATPAGSQFWGVWIANGPRNVANPDLNTLLWIPVAVPQPGSSFSVPWNIFNNGPGPRTDQAGNYTVFVRFLDGAGNPSTRVLSTTMTLDVGYSLPTRYLPMMRKP